jgi:hypothetical protein
MHDDHHPFRYLRTPRDRLVENASFRLRGGFNDGSGRKPFAED